MSLGHLLYVSDATRPMGRGDLENIRDTAVRNNHALGITGVLFYSARHFVQLLEGEEQTTRELFERICADLRHHHIRLLIERPADRRVFGDWDMGLLNLDDADEVSRHTLDELVLLAGRGETTTDGTPVELEILSRFCMLLPTP